LGKGANTGLAGRERILTRGGEAQIADMVADFVDEAKHSRIGSCLSAKDQKPVKAPRKLKGKPKGGGNTGIATLINKMRKKKLTCASVSCKWLG